MSDPSESKGFPCQFNNLIFTNHKWKEDDKDRDFSPDFQHFQQEFINKNTSSMGGRNNCSQNKTKTEMKDEKSHKPRKLKIDKESKKKRLDRSARVYKSQYNKPLILNEKEAEGSKNNIKKNIK